MPRRCGLPMCPSPRCSLTNNVEVRHSPAQGQCKEAAHDILHSGQLTAMD